MLWKDISTLSHVCIVKIALYFKNLQKTYWFPVFMFFSENCIISHFDVHVMDIALYIPTISVLRGTADSANQDYKWHPFCIGRSFQ